MSRKFVGIVDYGMGNHASVKHCLQKLGHRVTISREQEILNKSDLLILPGVGAFPAAMKALHKYGLVNFIKKVAQSEKPIIGICLGMELLATSSLEQEYTHGLDLIKGEVKPLPNKKWHIGWNTVNVINNFKDFKIIDGSSFYFNHSYHFKASKNETLALAYNKEKIAAIVRRKNIVGLQFHPEKSQHAGIKLFQILIKELC